ncbi:MAG: GatB/YqeY domain-containing protein [Burkholderiales bacterium]|nr:GatB/YqeY domain-containing protein [Burkholderiales bacterium]
MDMSLKATLTEHMKEAMRAKDAARLNTIRMALAEIKKWEIDKRTETETPTASDADIIAVIDKMIKQRKDSAAQYEKGGRADLAAAEQAEVLLLLNYMPQPLGEADIDAAIAKALAETGAQGMAGIGKVMAVLKPQLAGRADLTAVSAKVKAALL